MRAGTLFLFAYLGLSTASPLLDRRQAKSFGVPQKPVSYIENAGTLRSASKYVRVTYGPYKVPGGQAGTVSTGTASEAAPVYGGHSHGAQKPGNSADILNNMDPNGFLIKGILQEGICKMCTIIRAKAQVTNNVGKEVSIGSGVYLHHIVVAPTVTKEVAPLFGGCSQKSSGTPKPESENPRGKLFLAQGVENFTTWYTTGDGQFNSGYHAGNNGYALIAEVINYKTSEQNVYVTVDYDYIPGFVGSDANMLIVGVEGCLNSEVGFHIPANTRSFKAGNDVQIIQDGTIVNARGHMHDGGESIDMFLNDKLVCHSVAAYGGNDATMIGADGKKWDTISSMSDCPQAIPVKKGDRLRLQAAFDTATHPMRVSHGEEQEAMGLYILSFVPATK